MHSINHNRGFAITFNLIFQACRPSGHTVTSILIQPPSNSR